MIPKTELRMIATSLLVALRRNPQYLTPKQMESLKASIKRDGFCAPILVRPIKGKKTFEVISGNHRFMAASELKFKEIPCVVANLDTKSAQRLAVNLNTIHGNPNAELLAPFLAELDDDVLADIYIEEDMKKILLEFDSTLKSMLDKLQPPASINRSSLTHATVVCKCPTCGTRHVKKQDPDS